MLNTKVFNIEGVEVGTMELNESVFGAEYNEALIHQVVVAQLANKRQGTKSSLTRAEVRGGGAKPWKQKGTGRARQGSIRSPQWIKGGVVFAPKPRDFSQKINKVARREALKSALSAKFLDGGIIVLDDIKLNEAKTREVATILKNLSVLGKALMVIAEDNCDILRASGNIEKLAVSTAGLINVYDVVANAKCIMTKASIKLIEEALAE